LTPPEKTEDAIVTIAPGLVDIFVWPNFPSSDGRYLASLRMKKDGTLYAQRKYPEIPAKKGKDSGED